MLQRVVDEYGEKVEAELNKLISRITQACYRSLSQVMCSRGIQAIEGKKNSHHRNIYVKQRCERQLWKLDEYYRRTNGLMQHLDARLESTGAYTGKARACAPIFVPKAVCLIAHWLLPSHCCLQSALFPRQDDMVVVVDSPKTKRKKKNDKGKKPARPERKDPPKAAEPKKKKKVFDDVTYHDFRVPFSDLTLGKMLGRGAFRWGCGQASFLMRLRATVLVLCSKDTSNKNR